MYTYVYVGLKGQMPIFFRDLVVPAHAPEILYVSEKKAPSPIECNLPGHLFQGDCGNVG